MYTGSGHRQCSRPGSKDRDGQPVCGTHLGAEIVNFMDGTKSVRWHTQALRAVRSPSGGLASDDWSLEVWHRQLAKSLISGRR
jgi:hypothetical protein